MHRCRHEMEEDPYASGSENRRENRDRLNRDVALHDSIRQAIRRGYGPPYSGHMGLPGYPYGFGYGEYVPGPPSSPYGGHHGYPGFSGPYGKGFSTLLHDDGFGSEHESPPIRCPSSPHLLTSALRPSRRSRRSSCVSPQLLGARMAWMGACEHDHYHYPPRPAFEHEYYQIPPRPFFSHVGCSY